MRDPVDGFFTMVGRAARKRCPRCGSDGIFARRTRLHEWCPTCGMRFEREQGYWVGAMIMNMTATIVVLFVVLLGGIAFFWPAVPWSGLTVATVAATAATPVLLYPRSLTLWLATELSFHRLEPQEREEAAARAAGLLGRPESPGD